MTVSYHQEKGVRVVDTEAWLGRFARRVLTDELTVLNARRKRGRERPEDARHAAQIYRGLLDIDASYRALLRWEIEGCKDSRDLARLQADENIVSGLPLDTISPELLQAVHKKYPEWFPGQGCEAPGKPDRRDDTTGRRTG